jgi:hypothetical protein
MDDLVDVPALIDHPEDPGQLALRALEPIHHGW